MADQLPPKPARKPRTLSLRLSYKDRLYLDRIARIRNVSRAFVLAEMIEAHREQTLAAYAEMGATTDHLRAA